MSTMNRRRAATGSLALAVGVLIGAALDGGFRSLPEAIAAPIGATESITEVAPNEMGASLARDLSDAFSDLAGLVTPAVVQIEVEVPGREGPTPTELGSIPDPFRQFFGDPRSPTPNGPTRGGGSGFVVSQDGYIVTNDHVVGDASKIRVTLHDHRSFDATLVGADPTTDIAVIKIEGQSLPHVEWGQSSAVRVGSWVMAVGSPGVGGGQLQSTVTTGIVSAKGRPLQLIGQGLAADPRYGSEVAGYAIENFIQTDAVINPGNSGGPMVDLDGNVVGVNSAIASTDGHYQGYGFAIPSDLAKKVATDLIEHGTVRRPWLGVQVQAVTPEDAEAFGLPAVSGVVVQAVTGDGPAEHGGMVQGDVIVSVNGVRIESGGDLQQRIAILDQGEEASIGIFREGRSRTVDVVLGVSPAVTPKAAAAAPPEQGVSEESLGMLLRPLDSDAAQRLGFAGPGGVVIADVDPSGPAASRGVVPGLKLKRIATTEIATVEEASRVLSSVPRGRVVTLVVETPAGAERIVNLRTR